LRSGPIGGYNQEGEWKIDARFNKKDLAKRLEHIYDFKHQIRIYNYDALDFLKKILDLNIDPEKSMVYLDPPYYAQGRDLYRKYYKPKDHLALKEYLKNDLKIKWILSYDDIDEIHNLYSDVRKNGIVFNHFANKAKVGKELLIFSDNCIVPV
jgi:DNA adenine methylase